MLIKLQSVRHTSKETFFFFSSLPTIGLRLYWFNSFFFPELFVEFQLFINREIRNPCQFFHFLFVLSYTDICRDSSDDDQSDGSSQTEGYAVMDLIEFEVPSDSESDGNASTASSGTDVSLQTLLI